MTSRQIRFVESLEEELEINRWTTLKMVEEQTGIRYSRLNDIPTSSASQLINGLLEIKKAG